MLLTTRALSASPASSLLPDLNSLLTGAETTRDYSSSLYFDSKPLYSLFYLRITRELYAIQKEE